MYKSHDIITRHLTPYAALGRTSIPWSYHPPQVLVVMPVTLSFFQKSKPPTKNEYSSDLKKFTRMCSEGNLKRRIPEMFGAITTSIETSKGYIYPKVTILKRKIHLYCKSDLFCVVFKSAAATKVIAFLRVEVFQYGSQHAALRMPKEWMLVPALLMTPHPYKEYVIQHKAHAVAANYCRSLHQPREICQGILLRKWETC